MASHLAKREHRFHPHSGNILPSSLAHSRDTIPTVSNFMAPIELSDLDAEDHMKKSSQREDNSFLIRTPPPKRATLFDLANDAFQTPPYAHERAKNSLLSLTSPTRTSYTVCLERANTTSASSLSSVPRPVSAHTSSDRAFTPIDPSLINISPTRRRTRSPSPLSSLASVHALVRTGAPVRLIAADSRPSATQGSRDPDRDALQRSLDYSAKARAASAARQLSSSVTDPVAALVSPHAHACAANARPVLSAMRTPSPHRTRTYAAPSAGATQGIGVPTRTAARPASAHAASATARVTAASTRTAPSRPRSASTGRAHTAYVSRATLAPTSATPCEEPPRKAALATRWHDRPRDESVTAVSIAEPQRTRASVRRPRTASPATPTATATLPPKPPVPALGMRASTRATLSAAPDVTVSTTASTRAAAAGAAASRHPPLPAEARGHTSSANPAARPLSAPATAREAPVSRVAVRDRVAAMRVSHSLAKGASVPRTRPVTSPSPATLNTRVAARLAQARADAQVRAQSASHVPASPPRTHTRAHTSVAVAPRAAPAADVSALAATLRALQSRVNAQTNALHAQLNTGASAALTTLTARSPTPHAPTSTSTATAAAPAPTSPSLNHAARAGLSGVSARADAGGLFSAHTESSRADAPPALSATHAFALGRPRVLSPHRARAEDMIRRHQPLLAAAAAAGTDMPLLEPHSPVARTAAHTPSDHAPPAFASPAAAAAVASLPQLPEPTHQHALPVTTATEPSDSRAGWHSPHSDAPALSLPSSMPSLLSFAPARIPHPAPASPASAGSMPSLLSLSPAHARPARLYSSPIVLHGLTDAAPTAPPASADPLALLHSVRDALAGITARAATPAHPSPHLSPRPSPRTGEAVARLDDADAPGDVSFSSSDASLRAGTTASRHVQSLLLASPRSRTHTPARTPLRSRVAWTDAEDLSGSDTEMPAHFAFAADHTHAEADVSPRRALARALQHSSPGALSDPGWPPAHAERPRAAVGSDALFTATTAADSSWLLQHHAQLQAEQRRRAENARKAALLAAERARHAEVQRHALQQRRLAAIVGRAVPVEDAAELQLARAHMAAWSSAPQPAGHPTPASTLEDKAVQQPRPECEDTAAAANTAVHVPDTATLPLLDDAVTAAWVAQYRSEVAHQLQRLRLASQGSLAAVLAHVGSAQEAAEVAVAEQQRAQVAERERHDAERAATARELEERVIGELQQLTRELTAAEQAQQIPLVAADDTTDVFAAAAAVGGVSVAGKRLLQALVAAEEEDEREQARTEHRAWVAAQLDTVARAQARAREERDVARRAVAMEAERAREVLAAAEEEALLGEVCRAVDSALREARDREAMLLAHACGASAREDVLRAVVAMAGESASARAAILDAKRTHARAAALQAEEVRASSARVEARVREVRDAVERAAHAQSALTGSDEVVRALRRVEDGVTAAVQHTQELTSTVANAAEHAATNNASLRAAVVAVGGKVSAMSTNVCAEMASARDAINTANAQLWDAARAAEAHTAASLAAHAGVKDAVVAAARAATADAAATRAEVRAGSADVVGAVRASGAETHRLAAQLALQTQATNVQSPIAPVLPVAHVSAFPSAANPSHVDDLAPSANASYAADFTTYTDISVDAVPATIPAAAPAAVAAVSSGDTTYTYASDFEASLTVTATTAPPHAAPASPLPLEAAHAVMSGAAYAAPLGASAAASAAVEEASLTEMTAPEVAEAGMWAGPQETYYAAAPGVLSADATYATDFDASETSAVASRGYSVREYAAVGSVHAAEAVVGEEVASVDGAAAAAPTSVVGVEEVVEVEEVEEERHALSDVSVDAYAAGASVASEHVAHVSHAHASPVVSPRAKAGGVSCSDGYGDHYAAATHQHVDLPNTHAADSDNYSDNYSYGSDFTCTTSLASSLAIAADGVEGEVDAATAAAYAVAVSADASVVIEAAAEADTTYTAFETSAVSADAAAYTATTALPSVDATYSFAAEAPASLAEMAYAPADDTYATDFDASAGTTGVEYSPDAYAPAPVPPPVDDSVAHASMSMGMSTSLPAPDVVPADTTYGTDFDATTTITDAEVAAEVLDLSAASLGGLADRYAAEPRAASPALSTALVAEESELHYSAHAYSLSPTAAASPNTTYDTDFEASAALSEDARAGDVLAHAHTSPQPCQAEMEVQAEEDEWLPAPDADANVASAYATVPAADSSVASSVAADAAADATYGTDFETSVDILARGVTSAAVSAAADISGAEWPQRLGDSQDYAADDYDADFDATAVSETATLDSDASAGADEGNAAEWSVVAADYTEIEDVVPSVPTSEEGLGYAAVVDAAQASYAEDLSGSLAASANDTYGTDFDASAEGGAASGGDTGPACTTPVDVVVSAGSPPFDSDAHAYASDFDTTADATAQEHLEVAAMGATSLEAAVEAAEVEVEEVDEMEEVVGDAAELELAMDSLVDVSLLYTAVHAASPTHASADGTEVPSPAATPATGECSVAASLHASGEDTYATDYTDDTYGQDTFVDDADLSEGAAPSLPPPPASEGGQAAADGASDSSLAWTAADGSADYAGKYIVALGDARNVDGVDATSALPLPVAALDVSSGSASATGTEAAVAFEAEEVQMEAEASLSGNAALDAYYAYHVAAPVEEAAREHATAEAGEDALEYVADFDEDELASVSPSTVPVSDAADLLEYADDFDEPVEEPLPVPTASPAASALTALAGLPALKGIKPTSTAAAAQPSPSATPRLRPRAHADLADAPEQTGPARRIAPILRARCLAGPTPLFGRPSSDPELPVVAPQRRDDVPEALHVLFDSASGRAGSGEIKASRLQRIRAIQQRAADAALLRREHELANVLGDAAYPVPRESAMLSSALPTPLGDTVDASVRAWVSADLSVDEAFRSECPTVHAPAQLAHLTNVHHWTSVAGVARFAAGLLAAYRSFQLDAPVSVADALEHYTRAPLPAYLSRTSAQVGDFLQARADRARAYVHECVSRMLALHGAQPGGAHIIRDVDSDDEFGFGEDSAPTALSPTLLALPAELRAVMQCASADEGAAAAFVSRCVDLFTRNDFLCFDLITQALIAAAHTASAEQPAIGSAGVYAYSDAPYRPEATFACPSLPADNALATGAVALRHARRLAGVPTVNAVDVIDAVARARAAQHPSYTSRTLNSDVVRMRPSRAAEWAFAVSAHAREERREQYLAQLYGLSCKSLHLDWLWEGTHSLACVTAEPDGVAVPLRDRWLTLDCLLEDESADAQWNAAMQAMECPAQPLEALAEAAMHEVLEAALEAVADLAFDE